MHRKLLIELLELVYEFRCSADMASPGLLVVMDTFQLTPSARALNRMVNDCILVAPITTEVYWLAKFIRRTVAFMCHSTAQSTVMSNMKCWSHNLMVCIQFSNDTIFNRIEPNRINISWRLFDCYCDNRFTKNVHTFQRRIFAILCNCFIFPLLAIFIKSIHLAEWIQTQPHAPLPGGAILAGHDQDRTPMYIGRAYFEGDLIPAKVIPQKQAVYVAYNGKEHQVHTQYDVLCNGNINWVQASYGNIPPNAVHAGNTRAGERLYIGRAHHEGSLTVGKVHPSHGCVYIPFGGEEVRHDHFEVLVEE